jgi:DNA-binding NarL/FixJ family response regulator
MLDRTCARCGNSFQAEAKEYTCPACRKPAGIRKPWTGPLSFREQQIVSHIAQAKSNKQIAWDLHLAEGTVKEYLYRIFRKLNVSNRTELALRHGGNSNRSTTANV